LEFLKFILPALAGIVPDKKDGLPKQPVRERLVALLQSRQQFRAFGLH
jgi:hypothetical protein